MMPEAMQRRLVMLLCLQCGNGIETFHETERESSIAFALRISEAELAETKELFMRKEFINSDWTLRNWDKRQYASDSSTARVRRHREKSKKATETDETFQERSCNALEQNRTDTEQIKNTPYPRKRGAGSMPRRSSCLLGLTWWIGKAGLQTARLGRSRSQRRAHAASSSNWLTTVPMDTSLLT